MILSLQSCVFTCFSWSHRRVPTLLCHVGITEVFILHVGGDGGFIKVPSAEDIASGLADGYHLRSSQLSLTVYDIANVHCLFTTRGKTMTPFQCLFHLVDQLCLEEMQCYLISFHQRDKHGRLERTRKQLSP